MLLANVDKELRQQLVVGGALDRVNGLSGSVAKVRLGLHRPTVDGLLFTTGIY